MFLRKFFSRLLLSSLLALPAVREALTKQGFDVMGGSSQEFGQFMKSEIDKWTRVVNNANLPKL